MIFPKLISIDTSIFGKLAKDYYSRNTIKSKSARDVVQFLNGNGLIPFVTYHHIQEILQHENEKVVFSRWSLIGKFHTVAWMCGFDDRRVLGSSYDIHQLEVQHLLNRSGSSSESLSEKFKNRLIQHCSGEEFIASFEYVYSEASRLGYVDAHRSKEIESISHLQDKMVNETRLSELDKSKLKQPSEVASYLRRYESKFISGLEKRGDERLSNYAAIAREFIGEIVSKAKPLYENSTTSLLEAFVRNAGVRKDQITPTMTIGELGYLAVYNSKIEQILESLGIPLARARDLSPEESSTWVIWKYLDNAMKYEKRAHGSNMIDKHMSVLALYVDIFIVDKRVKEYFGQLKRKNSILGDNFGNVVKVSNYSELLGL